MTSWLLAIDPGPEESAWVLYDEQQAMPLAWAKVPNEFLLGHIESSTADRLVIEHIASYGMPVGAEVFETCVWIGRLIQHWASGRVTRHPAEKVYRREVKLHLCGSARAKDSNVRQALIDRYGPGKTLAIGRKDAPGPLYRMKGDEWAALGVAVTASDTRDTRMEAAA
jgi:hypothetical protein